MKHNLNLMTVQSRQREIVRSCVRFWSRVLLGLLVLLTGLGIAKWRVCHAEAQRQAAAEQEYEPSRQMKSEAGRLRKQLAAKRESQQTLLYLAKQLPLLNFIGLATATLGGHNEDIHLMEVRCERETLPADTPTQPPLRFVLEGAARDDVPVAGLVEALEGCGLFSQVMLNRTPQPSPTEPEAYLFTIECKR